MTISPGCTPSPDIWPTPEWNNKGCCFADRCEYATERCRTEAPSMHVCGEHGILCHRYAEKEEF